MWLVCVVTEGFRKTTNGSGTWAGGALILAKMRAGSFLGRSGLVRLDQGGHRTAFTLNLAHMVGGRSYSLGKWSTESGMLRSEQRQELATGNWGMSRETDRSGPLTISMLLSDPYVMRSEKGEGGYEGFAIDLVNRLAASIGFNYTISIATGYGSKNRDGTWNGMIGDVLEGRADMAVGDLTINSEREEVVDFSMPFLDLGISILYVSSPSKSIDLFSFMDPLSPMVWVLVLVAGVLVSLTIFLLARFSPFETAELDSNVGRSPFLSLRHCLWFSLSCWVQQVLYTILSVHSVQYSTSTLRIIFFASQGCDFLPRAVSTRTVASFWWFFTLIMISSYTANLAAFLTIDRMDSPITSVQDLATSDIRYGAVLTGSTAAFFKDSTSQLYRRMWARMKDWDSVLVDSNTAGVHKVVADGGTFAFFMESLSIEYQIERNCQLIQVGNNLDSKSYGIALPKRSILRPLLSSAIIRLKEQGVLAALKRRWWEEERGGGACTLKEKAGNVNRLTLHNLGGIFVVLVMGLVMGLILMGLEVLWIRWKTASKSI